MSSFDICTFVHLAATTFRLFTQIGAEPVVTIVRIVVVTSTVSVHVTHVVRVRHIRRLQDIPYNVRLATLNSAPYLYDTYEQQSF